MSYRDFGAKVRVDAKVFMRNLSVESEKIWTEDGLTFTELIRQQYGGNNCGISAGFIEGENKTEVDTCYLRLEKDGVEPTVLLLRPDEMRQSCGWRAEQSGRTLWPTSC